MGHPLPAPLAAPTSLGRAGNENQKSVLMETDKHGLGLSGQRAVLKGNVKAQLRPWSGLSLWPLGLAEVTFRKKT